MTDKMTPGEALWLHRRPPGTPQLKWTDILPSFQKSWEREAEQTIAAYDAIRARMEKRPTPEGFTEWGGGECPVRQRGVLEYVRRDGTTGWTTQPGALQWEHQNDGWDIVAYRVVVRET